MTGRSMGEIQEAQVALQLLGRIATALEEIAKNMPAQTGSRLPAIEWVGVQMPMMQAHECGSRIAQYDRKDILRCRGCGAQIAFDDDEQETNHG